MSDIVQEDPLKTPGMVIFVAVLNFLGAAFFALLGMGLLMILLFGNVLGFYEFVTKQINQYYAQTNFSMGLNVLFGFGLFVSILFTAFYVYVGTGLLKARKLAWYFQVALSVIGLLGFPFGTVINAVILVFFFQSNVRNYFNV